MKRFLAFSTAILVVFSATLLVANEGASSPPDALPDWVKSTGLLAGIAGGPLFAIWYAYYMTTNRIPALEKTYKEQVDGLHQQHVEYVKETNRIHADHIALITNNYRADMNAMWATKHDDDKALIDALRNLGEKFTCRYLAGAD